jgi:hypothetical protein
MIVKILSSSSKFSGVVYNTNKVDRNKGDLMKVANFGALQSLTRLRPYDYVNYLQMVASQNTRVKNPQFHAILSAKGKMYSAKELTAIAESWLEKMGYGDQPYLIVYHRDTENNHVHAVSARVTKAGKKINSAYEKLRAIGSLKEVLGMEKAMAYTFSTRAQYFMLMETLGLPGKEADEKTIAAKISGYQKPEQRIAELRKLFAVTKGRDDFKEHLSAVHRIDLLFHSAEGKEPYGYSIIDHEYRVVLKGSEVMPMKEWLALNNDTYTTEKPKLTSAGTAPDQYEYPVASTIRPVWIADDVDDQQIHGMRRRKQKKARTNTR